VQGKLTSYFQGKQIPPDPQKKDRPEDPSAPEELIPEGDNAEMVIVANTRFVNNQFLQMFPENQIFMQNMTDSLAIGGELIGIRSRTVTDRPLTYGLTEEDLIQNENDVEARIERKKTFHRVLGTIGVPVVLIAFGLTRMSMRNKRKSEMSSANNGS